MNHTICFIGGGNMARSLIGGLLARGWRAEQIVVADPMPAQLDSLSGLRNTHCTETTRLPRATPTSSCSP